MATTNDWEALAKARGLELSPDELDRVIEPLRALERRFRPLANGLSSSLDPATTFRANPEPGE